METQKFYNQIYNEARDLGCTHVQSAVCAAQSAIETGWGQTVKGNSYFGIKARRSWKGEKVDFPTHEWVDGKKVPITDTFRAYPNRRESVRDYMKVMSWVFPKVWNAKTISEAARNLAKDGRYKAPYATSEAYPKDVEVTALKRAPEAQLAYENWPQSESQFLSRGDKGEDVAALLQRLAELGFYDGPQDGVFGGGTEAAVMHFQRDAGLQVDGIVGLKTLAALDGWTEPPSEQNLTDIILIYVNQNAIRDRRLTKYLEGRLKEGVFACYGPGCVIRVYSGGQAPKGSGGPRTGSPRHDDNGEGGEGADIHVYLPSGVQIKGLKLGKLAQWWLAKGIGGAGIEMSGGGIHLDQHAKPPSGGGMFWTYKASDTKSYGAELRRMLEVGKRGELPPLYTPPSKSIPKPVKDTALVGAGGVGGAIVVDKGAYIAEGAQSGLQAFLALFSYDRFGWLLPDNAWQAAIPILLLLLLMRNANRSETTAKIFIDDDRENKKLPKEKSIMPLFLLKLVGKKPLMGIIRHALTTGGGFLTSSGIADADAVTGLVGALMAVIGCLWSWFTGEKVDDFRAKLEGLARHIITIIAGFLAQKGLVSPDLAAQLIPAIMTFVGFGLSALDKKKSENGFV